MGFGFFKKLKDGFKKGVSWLNKSLKKVQPIAKQILNEAPKVIKNEKIKNYFDTANEIYDVASDGIDAVDEAVNNQNYDAGINWVNKELKPRLKNRF